MATANQAVTSAQANAISIHTTLAGGDCAPDIVAVPQDYISIHTTLAGGDGVTTMRFNTSSAISIHTTLAGGDSDKLQILKRQI